MVAKVEAPFMMDLIRAIVTGDSSRVGRLLAAHPQLVRACLCVGATRENPNTYFFEEIKHHLYLGDTPLHAAASAQNLEIVGHLLRNGADITATNRRGAQALHYACDSGPQFYLPDPKTQEAIVIFLIKSGADANALDKSGVSPLHRAVRKRCTGAVRALLAGGAEIRLRNKNGSTPLHLAVQNTGSSGSGSSQSKARQAEIIELLLKNGAKAEDKDAQGKTVREWIREDWIKKLFE